MNVAVPSSYHLNNLASLVSFHLLVFIFREDGAKALCCETNCLFCLTCSSVHYSSFFWSPYLLLEGREATNRKPLSARSDQLPPLFVTILLNKISWWRGGSWGLTIYWQNHQQEGKKLEGGKMHLESNLSLKQCCYIYVPNASPSADIL